MPTLMIVDDEETIRRGLSAAIHRLAPEWEIIAEMEDGLEAVRVLDKVQPNLLIVDISMPGMNGIELTRHVADHYPNMSQIVLSGHDHFSYIQGTLRNGISDYLLKPLDRQELLAALKKVRQRIDSMNEAAKEQTSSGHLRLEKMVRQWLAGETSVHEPVEAGFRSIGWQVLDIQFAVMVTMGRADRRFPDDLTLEKMEQELWESFAGVHQAFGFLIAGKHHVLFLEGVGMLSSEIARQWLESWNRWNKSALEEDAVLTVGVSEAVDSIAHLPAAYRQAVQFCYEQAGMGVRPLSVLKDLEISATEERLLGAIAQGDSAGTQRLMRQWKDELMKIPLHHSAWIQLPVFHLFSFLLGRAHCAGETELGPNLEREVPWLLSRLAPPLSVQSLSTALDEFMERINLADEGSKTDSRKVIRIAKAYIHEHYADQELCLEQLAQFVFMNATYFSELFKQVSGDNFIEYVTRTRMNAARRLLLDTHLKTYEVAEKVGYTSAKYFSSLFRKHYGMTPTEYRDKG